MTDALNVLAIVVVAVALGSLMLALFERSQWRSGRNFRQLVDEKGRGHGTLAVPPSGEPSGERRRN